MANEKFGLWHPPTKEQKPVHIGFYENRYSGGQEAGVSYWDGHCWRYAAGHRKRLYQNLQWRGLAEKPE